jgi:hypothetical protein
MRAGVSRHAAERVSIDGDWFIAQRARASTLLSEPPARPHIVRVAPVGRLVAQFALPLELIQPQNRTRHAQPWKLAKLKSQCKLVMVAQWGRRRSEPLPGRPMVRCIRFSSVEPDKYNDGFKIAVDRLVELKFIADDAPSVCDLHQWWEYAPPKNGFGVVEVWTGAA